MPFFGQHFLLLSVSLLDGTLYSFVCTLLFCQSFIKYVGELCRLVVTYVCHKHFDCRSLLVSCWNGFCCRGLDHISASVYSFTGLYSRPNSYRCKDSSIFCCLRHDFSIFFINILLSLAGGGLRKFADPFCHICIG